MEIFLSYPSERLEIARAVYEFLRRLGTNIWFDKESLVPGQDWDRERLAAQKRADLTVLICSRETFEKPGVIQREVKQVLDLLNDKPLGIIHLICVRVEEIGLPPELAKYQWVNYFEPDWRVKLVRSLKFKFEELKIETPIEVEKFISNNGLFELTHKALSYSTDTLEAKAEFFKYNIISEFWDYVNSIITSKIYGSFYEARFISSGATKLGEKSGHRWQMSVEEVFRSGDLISIRFFTYYHYDTGRPGYGYSGFNAAGPCIGSFTLSQLFGQDNSDVARFLKDYCELDIKKKLLALGSTVDEFYWPDMKYDLWGAFSNFTFDKSGVSIYFNPWEILPQVFGAHQVHLPWEALKDRIGINSNLLRKLSATELQENSQITEASER